MRRERSPKRTGPACPASDLGPAGDHGPDAASTRSGETWDGRSSVDRGPSSPWRVRASGVTLRASKRALGVGEGTDVGAVFISHATEDTPRALELQARLEQVGYRSVFLDVNGIEGGSDWERTLWRKLATCEALIALNSGAFCRSQYCFAEVSQAKAQRKPIVPVRIDDSDIHKLLRSHQTIDMRGASGELQQGYSRIYRALEACGVAKGGWDGKRAPYPGLLAFDETDAPMFFGREEAAERALAQLIMAREPSAPAWFVLIGASGSGKSSLLRAGILPAVRAQRSRFVVVGPMTPGEEPTRRLALAFAQAFADLGSPREWRACWDALRSDSDDALLDLAFGLRAAARASDATVLLAIDQLDEALSPLVEAPSQPRAAAQLDILRRLRTLSSLQDRPFVVIATLRSDFLGVFQDQEALRDLDAAFEVVTPIPRQQLGRVVEGPAKLAGLEVEPSLVLQLVQDTETHDALPLLAFTLRELYDRHAGEGHITLEHYRLAGGLEQTVASAAERVLKASRPVDLRVLQRAFLALVRLGDGEQPVCRPARWEELPRAARPILQSFVQARLLVASGTDGQSELQVSHEALFRAWPTLRRWIEESRQLLGFRRRIAPLFETWLQANRSQAALLAGAVLGEARSWLSRNPPLPDAEREFLEASDLRDRQHQQDAQRRARLLRGASFSVAGVFACLSLLLWAESRRAQERAAALLREQGRQALHADRPTEAARRLSEAYALEPDSVPTRLLLRDAMRPLDALQYTLRGHRAAVLTASLSGDGRFLVTGSADRTAKVWSRESGQPITTLDGHEGAVLVAEFNPDSSHVITASDKTAQEWERETGKLLIQVAHRGAVTSATIGLSGAHILTAGRDRFARLWDGPLDAHLADFEHSDIVWSAVFSPDGAHVLTASRDRTAVLWDTRGNRLATLLGHSASVTSARFGPNGLRILTASDDHTARVWTARGELVATLRGHTGGLRDATFDPRGERIVTASDDDTARVWNADGEHLFTLDAHTDDLTTAIFSPAGDHIITAARDHRAALWDARDGTRIAVFDGHTGAVTAAAVDPEGNVLATASEDGTVKLWRLKAVMPTRLAGHARHVTAVAYSPDGHRILTASKDGTASVWDANTGRRLLLLDGGGAIATAAFGPSGQRIVTASGDTPILWDARRGTRIAVLKGHRKDVSVATFDPRGRWILTASLDHTARLFRADTGEPVNKLEGHSGRIVAAAFHANGERVVTASDDDTARVWQTRDATLVATLAHHRDNVTRAAFSPGGQYLVTASWDGRAMLWDARAGTRLRTLAGHRMGVTAAEFSPDERLVATTGADNTVRLWDRPSGKLRLTLRGHKGRVTGVRFGPDGTRLVTTGADGTIRVWDPRSEKPLTIVRGHGDEVTALAFRPDGARLVTASKDGAVKIWNVSLERRSPSSLARIIASERYLAASLQP